MLAWARERPVAAGVLLGLAAATKLYPLLLLGPLLVLCLRAGRCASSGCDRRLGGARLARRQRARHARRGESWARFYVFTRERGAGFSSIWYVLGQHGLGIESASMLNLLASGLLVLCCTGIAWLGLAAPRRPRLAQLAFLVVAAFLLTNKVYSPQYVLWLLPLAAMARPRWRDYLIWTGGEVIHFAGIWLFLAGFPNDGNALRALSAGPYGWTVAAHVAGTLWLVAVVVRDVLHPEHDIVRADGSDDPGGGPLDGAPDVLVLGDRVAAR